MVREFSAGGVVVRHMRDRWWIAAIEPQTSTPKAKQVKALPKGLVNLGERPEHAAQREVLEETGLQTTLIGKLDDIKYVYVRTWGDHQRVFKMVSFYLFAYNSGKLGDITEEMRQEVRSAMWLPLDEAARLLTYSGERSVVRLAQKFLASNDASQMLQEQQAPASDAKN
jgi:ADP-ribose pyrophosphatase YjhB (NUDIX family)